MWPVLAAGAPCSALQHGNDADPALDSMYSRIKQKTGAGTATFDISIFLSLTHTHPGRRMSSNCWQRAVCCLQFACCCPDDSLGGVKEVWNGCRNHLIWAKVQLCQQTCAETHKVSSHASRATWGCSQLLWRGLFQLTLIIKSEKRWIWRVLKRPPCPEQLPLLLLMPPPCKRKLHWSSFSQHYAVLQLLA